MREDHVNKRGAQDYVGGARGWHSNIFCTPIFVLGQDESQGTTTEKSRWSKVKLSVGWTRVNLAFYVEYGHCTS